MTLILCLICQRNPYIDPDRYPTDSDEEPPLNDDEPRYFIPSPEFDDGDECILGPGYEGFEEDENEHEDHNHLFESMGTFSCRKDVEAEVTRIGRENNMFFTVTSSKKTRVYIGCECSGKYRTTIRDIVDVVPRASSGTKKNGCPFQLKLKNNGEGQWVVQTSDGRGKHNHALGNQANWHISASKLNEIEQKFVAELYKTHLRPKSILGMMKDKFVGNVSNVRHIYNSIQKK